MSLLILVYMQITSLLNFFQGDHSFLCPYFKKTELDAFFKTPEFYLLKIVFFTFQKLFSYLKLKPIF